MDNSYVFLIFDELINETNMLEESLILIHTIN